MGRAGTLGGVLAACVLACVTPGVGGASGAWAAPAKKKPAPAAHAKVRAPAADPGDDDLEGKPRHAVDISIDYALLVEDDYRKTGDRVRATLVGFSGPGRKDYAPISVMASEIDCSRLRLRVLSRYDYEADMSDAGVDETVSDWTDLPKGTGLTVFAQVACKGGRWSKVRVPTAPLDELYMAAYDAPASRRLVEVADDRASFVALRKTPPGLRPQVLISDVLRAPDEHGVVFVTTALEIDCGRSSVRVHRTSYKDADGKSLGVSGTEKRWGAMDETGPFGAVVALACRGETPAGEALEGSLVDLRGRLLSGGWTQSALTPRREPAGPRLASADETWGGQGGAFHVLRRTDDNSIGLISGVESDDGGGSAWLTVVLREPQDAGPGQKAAFMLARWEVDCRGARARITKMRSLGGDGRFLEQGIVTGEDFAPVHAGGRDEAVAGAVCHPESLTDATLVRGGLTDLRLRYMEGLIPN